MIKISQKIPYGWKNTSLQKVVTKIGDGLHATPNYSDGDKYFFINGNNISNGKILITKNTKTVNNEQYLKYKLDLDKCTLLLSINGTIGNVAYYKGEKVILGKSAAYINCSELTNRNYLFFLLNASKTRYYFDSELTGSTIKNLSLKSIRELQFFLPPLPEQKAIVEVLETWDKYLEQLDREIMVKKQVKKGLMQQLLTGKKRLPGFMGEWKKIKIKEFCDISRGGSPRPIEKYLTNGDDGINWLRIGDIDVDGKCVESTTDKIIKEGTTKTRIVRPGDFILSNSMSFGRPYIMKITAAIHDGWLALKNIRKIVDKDFLYYLLLNEKTQALFHSLAAGSGVKNLNKDLVKEIVLLLPEIDEQVAIAEVLGTADEEIQLLERKRELVAEQKKFLLNDLITGEMRLPEFVN